MKSLQIEIAKWRKFVAQHKVFSHDIYLRAAAFLMIIAGLVCLLTKSDDSAADDASMLLFRGWVPVSNMPCASLASRHYYLYLSDELDFEFYITAKGALLASEVHSDLKNGKCVAISRPNLVEEIKW